MCGIAGIWKSSEESLVREMLSRIAHRGPDSVGVCRDPEGYSALGSRRLSIIDPAGGDQPILSDRPRCGIVVNGEIYNHVEIRRSVGETRFRTGSDSESILQAYLDGRRNAAPLLDGMYAFILQDGSDLFIGRDPLGIKPLYVGKRGSAWCFASEIKALVGITEEIREFPPGTTLHTARGFQRFYDVPEVAPEPVSAEEAARVLRDAVERAVVKRLMSDVPLGVFLSGGLDSSVVAAVARRHVDPLHTFSVGIEGSQDLAAARAVSAYLGTVHHEYLLTAEEIAAQLPGILYHLESFDQDLVRSAIPCYFVSRLAADHVKVVLTGEGADELFAGYRYHKRYLDQTELAQELRRSVRALHNINLQRVDRMTMAHSVEARVPFLDLELVSLAQRIESHLKLQQHEPHGIVEKWVLRRACEDLLPKEIVWRDKRQFDEGSGTLQLLPLALETWDGFIDHEGHVRNHPDMRLRSAEECVYHALLVAAYPDPEPILSNVARWSERPDGSTPPPMSNWHSEGT
jgi:asparagine synthase (glutamine-hydrolysing)